MNLISIYYADSVTGELDAGYSVLLDIYYNDGTTQKVILKRWYSNVIFIFKGSKCLLFNRNSWLSTCRIWIYARKTSEQYHILLYVQES